ncbi:hypothetical protein BD289DRAFT_140652 [Coniella lustricola]|uniref:Uncharacterized protein n=1 Tax=Coniella lustricola TaxID=2025994 RepID=A0A2T3AF86_9PEZI|nr:hypothetical protein BD289DRAFT_140652 [Coniella lustricola]
MATAHQQIELRKQVPFERQCRVLTPSSIMLRLPQSNENVLIQTKKIKKNNLSMLPIIVPSQAPHNQIQALNYVTPNQFPPPDSADTWKPKKTNRSQNDMTAPTMPCYGCIAIDEADAKKSDAVMKKRHPLFYTEILP